MRRNGLITVLGCIVFFGACDQPVTTPDAGTPLSPALDRSEADVPARSDPWRSMSTDDMWAYIARHDSSVTLGIKAPGKRRGVYNGRWLLRPSAWNDARATAGKIKGVTLLQVDGFLPAVRLKVSSPAVLDHIRGLPFVDYVEPVVLDGVAGDPPSGGPSLQSSGAAHSILSPSEPRFSSSSGGDPNYGYYVGPTGDWIPNIFTGMRIEDAWAVTGGQGAVIADIDTGIRDNNPQLADWQRYTVSESGGSSQLDNTKHGTHQAGVIGAAQDGSCVVGVAYGATHISVKHSNDFIDVNTWRVTAALDTAVAHGAKVINMPFKSDDGSNQVTDRLEMYYSGTDVTGRRYDVLFVAAAGSAGDVDDGYEGVIFPAQHEDVIAVSAIDYDTNQPYSGILHGSADGPQVELSAYHGQPTTGDLEEGYCSATSGNTSNASSIVAGIAALVRARYPNLSNVQVRTKLRRGVHDLGPVGRDVDYGYGIINAYAAVGGFYQIKMFASHNDANSCIMYTNISTRRCYYNYETHGCMVETFRAVAYGDGPFTYRWADGSTSDSKNLTICPSYLPGYDYSLSVTVTDTNLHRSATLDLSIDAKPSDLQDPKVVKPTEPAVGA